MMGKYKWSIVLVVMIVFLSVFSNKEEGKVIKVGLLVDLTSNTSQMGIQGRDAAIYALERFNESQQAIKIQLSIKNTEGDCDKIIELMKELKNEKVKIVIGPLTSGETKNMMGMIDSGDYLFFSPTASTDSLAKKDDYFIRTTGLASEQGVLLAEMTLKAGNHQKIAIIYDNTNEAFILPAISSYQNAIIGSNVSVSYIEEFSPSKNHSFIDSVDRVMVNQIDGVVYFGTGTKAANYLQTLQVEGYKGHKYLSMWSSTPELIPNSGSAAEGVYLVGVVEPNKIISSKYLYRDKFYDKYGFEPSYVAYMTDETMNILFKAISVTQNDDPEALKSTIIGFGSFEGYGTKFSINKDGDSTRRFIPLIVKDGILQRVD